MSSSRTFQPTRREAVRWVFQIQTRQFPFLDEASMGAGVDGCEGGCRAPAGTNHVTDNNSSIPLGGIKGKGCSNPPAGGAPAKRSWPSRNRWDRRRLTGRMSATIATSWVMQAFPRGSTPPTGRRTSSPPALGAMTSTLIMCVWGASFTTPKAANPQRRLPAISECPEQPFIDGRLRHRTEIASGHLLLHIV